MISILLPVYNGERYLNKTIDSVLSQTYKDFELLIGFNGTKDNSKKIVSEYNDSRIRVFDYGDDTGKSRTLNKLLKESNGDWIALQDDDDRWSNNKLERQILHTDNFDVIGTQMQYCDENDNFINGTPRLSLSDYEIKYNTIRGNNHIANSSSLTNKKILLEIGGWNEKLTALEDFDLWIRLIVAGYKFINIDEVHMYHRIHSNSNFNTIDYRIQNDIMINILRTNCNESLYKIIK